MSPDLPPPRVDHWEWQRSARCRSMASSVFFPPEGLRGPTLRYSEQAAKAVCSLCPALTECRRYAIDVQEPHGIWGGLTPAERSALAEP
ncbi:WhiB family transcriptional regulator [Rhodococcus sp. 05-340-1]|jgi:WhiB family redox-sensing transcriptional regulator|uniref:WhiB family transcriptional regulator n=1 Tax=Nocardiaceae TaxID=85025 RepID=UPI000565CD64|nr:MULTISPECIES: WhiB family transcriptional regulator [Rhodococcus]OZD68101.1 WhiB family transcriptional regulator [Rhodococcus sp. 05-340-2]OZD85107.1 WhiB family transcriptional regulator [Rhodococcus sp. 05-340-1]OZE90700.1 WhiB family transcriptional regulator [Rhodococcus sp. 15-2388-1-1a]OZF30759.1 WhiB family transcriptional regulator [Rhodococcus sp. 14-2483-1-2]